MTLEPLCFIRTPFIEKFGVPRQSLLVADAIGEMVFPKNDFYAEAFRGIETFSHLWLIFEFHQVEEKSVQALVRPPRFEGKMKLGVFATRSPHRPNRMGLSVVKFLKIEEKKDSVHLFVSGVDLVDGTPILDIKPYIPYADSVDATAPLFPEAPPKIPVVWKCSIPPEKNMVEEIVSLDPRPGHQKNETTSYGLTLNDLNIRFQMAGDQFEILEVERKVLGSES
ncbi:MAG: tRNA (N6-threonylcarbamoyladenosine(37)-N6)-methyltransferase TrmO [Bdellovibrionota bacterium]